MPLEMADAKAMARQRLAGKNAKPADVNRMAQKLINESYDTQRGGTRSSGGSYDYETASGQGMQSKSRGGGDRVEYQTSDLSNYIDKVLGMGGLKDAPQGSTQVRPATPDEISTAQQTPDQGPIPNQRPGTETETPIVAPGNNGGPDLPLKEILAGTAGLAALTALYRYARRKGVKPEQLTPDEVKTVVSAAQSDAASPQGNEPMRPYQGPSSSIQEQIDEQVSTRPRISQSGGTGPAGSTFGSDTPPSDDPKAAPIDATEQPSDKTNPKFNQFRDIAELAATIDDVGERMKFIKGYGLQGDDFDEVLRHLDEVIQHGGGKVRTPKMKPKFR